jgi:thiamine-monophosphate kinase
MPRPSEDDLIATTFAPLAGAGGLGLRDDAACLTPPPGGDLVLSKDMLVAGVHFFADDAAGDVARKALRVNLSDLAAKAAAPLGFLLGLALPPDWREDWLAAFAVALGADATAFAVPLLGGDTVKTPGPLSISITVLGSVPAGGMVRRAGTRAGDALYVSGTIGDAALGLAVRRGDAAWAAALDPAKAATLRDRYLLPQPRLALRAALSAHARAAMDISDGFVGDLAKMLALDGLGATVEASRVPLSDAARAALTLDPALLATALTGGDDYEVLCSVPPDASAAFEAAASAAGCPVTAIGTAVARDGVVLLEAGGLPMTLSTASYQHFT